MSLVMDSDPSAEAEEPEVAYKPLHHSESQESAAETSHTPTAKKMELSLELDSSAKTDDSVPTSSVSGMAQFKIDG